jgi:chromate transporter
MPRPSPDANPICAEGPAASDSQLSVSFAEAALVWTKIGWLSFGGPAGQVALMHKELVERRKWIDETRFLHALNYCMLLPGPEAQQLATYIGWLMHRTLGGLSAGLLFVFPGFVSILVLSALYAAYRALPAVNALFFGLKAAVLALVVEAVVRIGRRALRSHVHLAVAASAFVGIWFFAAPFPAVVLAAGVLGWFGNRWAPRLFAGAAGSTAAADSDTVVERMQRHDELGHTAPSAARALRVALVCSVLWAAPVLLLWSVFGASSVFVREGVFFSKTAVVTFGGAYAVLAYIAQRAVETYAWLRPGEMLDGLGLAETTPGPLIMVVQFVGFLGAYRHPGGLAPMWAGVLGASITVWVTFVPCFLWIFAGAPYIEALRGNRGLAAALSSITAAVVGVILNLSLWFGVHVLFRQVSEQHFGPLRVLIPELASIDAVATALAMAAMLATFRFHVSAPRTLAACAALGMLSTVLGLR